MQMENLESGQAVDAFLPSGTGPCCRVEAPNMLRHFGAGTPFLDAYVEEEDRSWQTLLLEESAALNEEGGSDAAAENLAWTTATLGIRRKTVPGSTEDGRRLSNDSNPEQGCGTSDKESSLLWDDISNGLWLSSSNDVIVDPSSPLFIQDCFHSSGMEYHPNGMELPNSEALSPTSFFPRPTFPEDAIHENSSSGKACPPECDCLVCFLSSLDDNSLPPNSTSLDSAGFPTNVLTPNRSLVPQAVRTESPLCLSDVPHLVSRPDSVRSSHSSSTAKPASESHLSSESPSASEALSTSLHDPSSKHSSVQQDSKEDNPSKAMTIVTQRSELNSKKASSRFSSPTDSSEKDTCGSDSVGTVGSVVRRKSLLTQCDQSSRPPDMSARLAEILSPLEVSKSSVKFKDPYMHTSTFPPFPSSPGHPLEKRMRIPLNTNSVNFKGVSASSPMQWSLGMGESFGYLGDMQVRSVKYDKGRSNSMYLSPQKLKDMLISLAEAYATDDQAMVLMLISKLKTYANPKGSSMERLVIHFMDALSIRNSGRKIFKQTPLALMTEEDFVHEMDSALEKLPFLSFCWNATNSAIIRSIGSSSEVHILELGISRMRWWEHVIRHMSQSCVNGQLRITEVSVPGSLHPVKCPYDMAVNEFSIKMSAIGMKYGVRVSFKQMTSRLENLTPEMLELSEGENLIITSTFQLHELVDSSVVRSNPRDSVLKLFRDLEPKLFCIADMDVDLNGPFFLARFRECVDFYSHVFGATETCIPKADLTRDFFEFQLLNPDLTNCVAKEGSQRLMRTERLEGWRSRMVRAGFLNVPASSDSLMLMDGQARMFGDGFRVFSSDGDLLLSWRNQPMLFVCNWIPVAVPVSNRKRRSITMSMTGGGMSSPF